MQTKVLTTLKQVLVAAKDLRVWHLRSEWFMLLSKFEGGKTEEWNSCGVFSYCPYFGTFHGIKGSQQNMLLSFPFSSLFTLV